jgi:hypothetical protein
VVTMFFGSVLDGAMETPRLMVFGRVESKRGRTRRGPTLGLERQGRLDRPFISGRARPPLRYANKSPWALFAIASRSMR